MRSFPISTSSDTATSPAGTEYLIVACNVTRVVTVDGRAVGRTDEVLQVPAGEYTVSLLRPPADFRPKDRRVALRGTNPDKPLVIRFETR